MNVSKRIVRLFIFLTILFSVTTSLSGQIFTYQGELQQNGAPANGSFGMAFTLWDSDDGGNELGSVNFIGDVPVINGRFAVELDFGQSPFRSGTQWLQIRVNGTTLSPRTRISAAPFALQTRGLSVDAEQRVGLGTTDPLARLDVVSDTASAGTARFFAPAIGPRLSFIHVGTNGDWNINSANNLGRVLIQTGAGQVGVGIANPSAKLQVLNSDANEVSLKVGNNRPGYAIETNSSSDVTPASGGVVMIGAENGYNIAFDSDEMMARRNGVISDLLINDAGGNVNIGPNSGGTSRLITPVVQITGGSDFSEMFDVRGKTRVEPGMVVAIDPDNPGCLVPSSQANDRRVAGIISGAGGVATGMTMGQKGTIADGEHPVALSGRVYCLVDATDAAIETGDMLTTSSTVGHAMKVEDPDSAAGAIIGKAMTALKQGEKGLVLVLVNLQ